MKVILFGSTGMVGQGVLRECLSDNKVTQVLTIVRSSTGTQHPKLKEIVHRMDDFKDIESQFAGYDACYFCLGTPSSGKSEEEYSKITYDLTLRVAETLSRLNPQMTFIYVSGLGADSSEKGPVMWARVRGRTENALFRLPFKGAYVFRPGFIEPMDGIHSKTKLYKFFYVAFGPLIPVMRKLAPDKISSTRNIGQAMLQVTEAGAEKKILETNDFNLLAAKRMSHASR